jgi:hypothetical protein
VISRDLTRSTVLDITGDQGRSREIQSDTDGLSERVLLILKMLTQPGITAGRRQYGRIQCHMARWGSHVGGAEARVWGGVI